MMITVKTVAGDVATVDDNNVCDGDATTCNLLLYIIDMMPYGAGDKHVAAARYIQQHPKLSLDVLESEMMAKYDGGKNEDIIY